VPVLPLLLVAVVGACGPSGSDTQESGSRADDVADESSQRMMDDLLTLTAVAKDKILGLANAMPEDTYAWAPMEGVRSAGEVFIHVAADNYFIPVLMGVDAPAGTGITGDYETVRAFEAQRLSKAEILEVLEASFVHLEEAAATTRHDLSAELSFGSNTFTTRALWAQAITHVHEHLGQSIAYARANRVVPPWSM
jgi:uncharacterized damage-inducible protein DinB